MAWGARHSCQTPPLACAGSAGRWRIVAHAPYPGFGRRGVKAAWLFNRQGGVCKRMAERGTNEATAARLKQALRTVIDPTTGKDIVTAGLIEGIEMRGGLVQVALLTDRAKAPAMEAVCRQVEAALARQP